VSSILRFDEWQDSNGNPVASAPNGVGAFNAREVITATNASWPVPTLGSPIVRLTVVGGGGGGGGAGGAQAAGGSGGTTTFDASTAGSVTATGGAGGVSGATDANGVAATSRLSSDNGGGGAHRRSLVDVAQSGAGGEIVIGYLNLSGISTANVTIGAGGSSGAGTNTGAAGAGGIVVVEYVAG
jgi:hypothetical protein